MRVSTAMEPFPNSNRLQFSKAKRCTVFYASLNESHSQLSQNSQRFRSQEIQTEMTLIFLPNYTA
uniref:Uncharacterized protein n=1 Tax=Mesocestoides corti TaxID=53468 RepID=A0A5K3F9P7_MESCO